MAQQLDHLFGSLELPLRADEEKDALIRLKEFAVSRDSFASEDDYAFVLDNAINNWISNGEVEPELTQVVDVLLQGTTAENLGLTAESYFKMYAHLGAGGGRDWKALEHHQAVRLLSRCLLVHNLLLEERLSSSQISRLLANLESSVSVPYKAIQVLARHFHLTPSISQEQLDKEIWPKDAQRAQDEFVDSTLVDSCRLAQELANTWAPENSLERQLLDLTSSLDATSDENDAGWRYLQMLHWCCIPLEYYDHPASHVYEFSVRGNVATSLFKRYSHVVTGNPFLNNAKAVAKLDRDWARNRSGKDAHGLVEILLFLESLPFKSRREIARVLRAWLVRLIEIRSSRHVPMESPPTWDTVQRICSLIAGSETNTKGVIEQRVIDSLSAARYSNAGWRARGLGDSVNATNLSRRKLGDVEFVFIKERVAVAIEAHGGVVTQAYFQDHRRSLARGIQQRLEDSWGSIDDPGSWTIQVRFVAHRVSDGLPTKDEIEGVQVKYAYLSYDEFIQDTIESVAEEDVVNAFKIYYFDALNSMLVPQWIRNRADELVNANRI